MFVCFFCILLFVLLIVFVLDVLVEVLQGGMVEVCSSDVCIFDQVQVIGQVISYVKMLMCVEMLNWQIVMSSVNDVFNEVFGVVVSEVDVIGLLVWGMQISMCGFVINCDIQQIGIIIDGLFNGGLGYGGGLLVNCYIDIFDLEMVEVSQGIVDIFLCLNEVLGGIFNFFISDLLQDSCLCFVVGVGDNEVCKYYVCYDIGLFGGYICVWVSVLLVCVYDWIDGSGKISNDYIVGKFIIELDCWILIGYLFYNDVDELEYISVLLKGFVINLDCDNLVGIFIGIFYLDQNYCFGLCVLCENIFGYLCVVFDGGNGFKVLMVVYGYCMQGRGDWLLLYLVQVSDDGVGCLELEYIGGKMVYGGSNRGQIFFVNFDGSVVQCLVSCILCLGFIVEYDLNCYVGNVLGVQLYCYIYYDNDCMGVMVDVEWCWIFGVVDNIICGGLWVEKLDCLVCCDWYCLFNVGQDIVFDYQLYWVQFEDKYKVDEQMYYVEDVVWFGLFSVCLGVKQFFVDQLCCCVIGVSEYVIFDFRFDLLLFIGLIWVLGV